MKKFNIPFSPPDISDAEIELVADALRSGWITTGPKTKLLEKGFDIGHSQSAVVPVMVYSKPILFEMYDKLRKRGVYVNIVTYPAVRRKECRLRLCAMKDLNFKQIDKAVEIIAELGREYGLIK